MTDFTPLQSLFGGALIGLAALLLMAALGRVAGISGILGGILPGSPDRSWRAAFLGGAIVAPIVLVSSGLVAIPFESPSPWLWTAASGLLVGFGVSFGGGCTSGHGVCGLARLSRRSVVATVTFMITAGLTVYVIRHVVGGL